jgi:hypothetical protein
VRFVFALCLCACLHAQADPIIPPEPSAPDGLTLWLESRFGYDTNVRLNDNRRKTSAYLQGGGFAGHSLALPFGRLFAWGGALGRLQVLETDASVWSLQARAGWAYGKPRELAHLGADIGLSGERSWIYEIYGPATRHDSMLRGVYDFRTWGELHYTGIVAEGRFWIGAHDFSEVNDDVFFQPSNFRFRSFAPPMPEESHDLYRLGAFFWLAGAPKPTFALGPYFWFDASHFIEQHNISQNESARNARLRLARYQVGSRIQVESEHVGLDTHLYYRAVFANSGFERSPLEYEQYGMHASLRLEWPIIVGRLGLSAWIREYDDFLRDADVIVPGGTQRRQGGSDAITEAGSGALVEIRVRPVVWLEAGARYEWEEWASNLPDMGYRKHDISLVVLLKW